MNIEAGIYFQFYLRQETNSGEYYKRENKDQEPRLLIIFCKNRLQQFTHQQSFFGR